MGGASARGVRRACDGRLVRAGRARSRRRTLTLATVDAAGRPLASYVPFAVVAGRVAFVVSGLAAHATHLAARPAVSMLISGDEGGDAYARPRVTIDADASRPAPGAATDAVWNALAARHGETVAILRTLADFVAYVCEPTGARLVTGFASAHALESEAVHAALRSASQS